MAKCSDMMRPNQNPQRMEDIDADDFVDNLIEFGDPLLGFLTTDSPFFTQPDWNHPFLYPWNPLVCNHPSILHLYF